MRPRIILAGAGALALVAGAVALAMNSAKQAEPGAHLEQPAIVAQEKTAAVNVPSSSPAVARLGDLLVGSDEVATLLAATPATSRELLRDNRPALEAWLRSRLAEKALLEQARAQGWQERAEIQKLTQAATEQIVSRSYLDSVSQVPANYPGEEELKNAYEAGKANWVNPALYRVSQIFLAVDDKQPVEVARRQAQELAKYARAEKVDFATLAQQYSQDPSSAQRGGDSGLQPLQQLLPEVRPVLSRLKVGAVADPVQSAAGFHIVKLIDMQPARIATFDEVRGPLRDGMRKQRQEQIAKAYLEGLLNTATLSIDGAALSRAIEGGQ